MYKKRGLTIRLVAGIVLVAALLSGCTGTGNGGRGNGGGGESTESSGGGNDAGNKKKRDRYGELEAIHYSPGYGDMDGEYHSETVRRDENGDVVYVIKDRESFNEPAVTRTYDMPEDALTRLEDIIREYDLTDLENRRKSERLVTDYSPWSYQFVFEKDNVRLTEFRRYKKKDLEHLKELMDTAHAMRGELISTEKEGDDEAGGTQDEEDIAEQNFRYSHGGYSREEFIAYVYGTMWAKNGDENSAIVDLWEDGTFIAVEGMGGVVEATGTYEFRADLYGPHRPFLFTMYREDGSVFTEFELVYSHNLEGEIVLFFGDNIYRRIY